MSPTEIDTRKNRNYFQLAKRSINMKMAKTTSNDDECDARVSGRRVKSLVGQSYFFHVSRAFMAARVCVL